MKGGGVFENSIFIDTRVEESKKAKLFPAKKVNELIRIFDKFLYVFENEIKINNCYFYF